MARPNKRNHKHDFKAHYGISELAFYECSCGETRGSNWNGEEAE